MERLNWGWKSWDDGNLSRQVQTSLLIFHESWHFREIDGESKKKSLNKKKKDFDEKEDKKCE